MLDGFSFANLGAEQKLTSAELALNADRLAKQGRNRTVQNIDQASKDSTINDEDLTEKEGSGFSLYGESSNEDGTTNDENENDENTSKFIVKLNTETQLLELIELQSEKIIQKWLDKFFRV